MEIKSIRALWGPNSWSVSQHQVVVVQLIFEESEKYIGNDHTAFYETLKSLFPALFVHCESDQTEGLLSRLLNERCRVEPIIEYIASELQRLAGMDYRPILSGITDRLFTNHAVFGYEVKEAGIFAGKAAVKIVECLLKGEQYNTAQDIAEIKRLAEQHKPGPAAAFILTQAKSRGIPAIMLDDKVYIQLGYGAKQKRIEASVVSTSASDLGRLFSGNDDGRIPIIAVTGTNGKTTTTRLIAEMTQLGGYVTGYTTTEGIYINKELIHSGDCSGPGSARVVLKDPAVEMAVLESARGGIIRSGLGFDQCDCAVVTNIAEDHLGIDGIDTIEGIAAVKSVVPQTVKPQGFAVLNADDNLAYAMKEKISCKLALFSLQPENSRIKEHCAGGGLAAVWKEGSVLFYNGTGITVIEEVDNIPITYNGKARFNIANTLAASLAAYVTGIGLPAIRCSLRSFNNSSQLTPGRMNWFSFGNFTVMLDYAHNPHGLRALGEFIKTVPATKRRGVIAGVGDRRAEDIIALGEEAAKIFDDIIIRMDANLRGRTLSEISDLLKRGIHNIQPGKEVLCFSDELGAVEHAVDTAKPDTFTVILVENITAVDAYLQQRLNQHRENIR